MLGVLLKAMEMISRIFANWNEDGDEPARWHFLSEVSGGLWVEKGIVKSWLLNSL
jgi:hypothetical protein